MAARRFAELLRQLPGLPVNDGFVGVLKDHPFILRIFNAVFVLIGFLMGTEVDGIAHILRFGEDVSDDISAPVIWV